MEDEAKARGQKELQIKKILEAKIEVINRDVENTLGAKEAAMCRINQ
jgi:hypothetical protein